MESSQNSAHTSGLSVLSTLQQEERGRMVEPFSSDSAHKEYTYSMLYNGIVSRPLRSSPVDARFYKRLLILGEIIGCYALLPCT
jgi:hypothetical protein